jgi:DNA-binding winged helix-turn-helix (wHTH) protein
LNPSRVHGAEGPAETRRNSPLSIRKLRKKIAAATGGDHYIETVWGRGYVLKDPEVQPDAQTAGAQSGAHAHVRAQVAVA